MLHMEGSNHRVVLGWLYGFNIGRYTLMDGIHWWTSQLAMSNGAPTWTLRQLGERDRAPPTWTVEHVKARFHLSVFTIAALGLAESLPSSGARRTRHTTARPVTPHGPSAAIFNYQIILCVILLVTRDAAVLHLSSTQSDLWKMQKHCGGTFLGSILVTGCVAWG